MDYDAFKRELETLFLREGDTFNVTAQKLIGLAEINIEIALNQIEKAPVPPA